MNDKKWSFTSESVTEGHPDKVCDQIADAILDEMLALDPMTRSAIEAFATTGMVLVSGEVTTERYVDINNIVRSVISDIGYIHPDYGFESSNCAVMTSINGQSPDIAGGVSLAVEARAGSADTYDALGAGDQGMVFGYACGETPELMPLPIALAHKMAMELAAIRKSGKVDYLRPDGKTQVSVSYEGHKPVRVTAAVVSTQHSPNADQDVIYKDMTELVIKKIIPANLLDDNTKYYTNPSGRFVIGGPQGDTGLTGRKIIVDTYGGMCRHGGGSFSGKDATKVDRSATYMMRYVAKNLVAAGVAERCEIHATYAIGVSHPLTVDINTYGTSKLSDEAVKELIFKHFDLRPAAIIERLELRRPIFRQVASYGHFGRPDLDLPWERTDAAARI